MTTSLRRSKIALHAHDRMQERTPFPADLVDTVQKEVDAKKLPKGNYHVPLLDAKGFLRGYAQFKSVPNRALPVLATVLAPTMQPSGPSIFFKRVKK